MCFYISMPILMKLTMIMYFHYILMKLTMIMYFHKTFNLADNWSVTHRA